MSREMLVSGVFVRGFKAAAVKLGLADKLRAAMAPDPAVVALWEHPESASWHPGVAFQQLAVLTAPVLTNEEMVAINLVMSQDQFGPIVSGMIRIAVAITGPSPHTVMKNMPTMVTLANRGLDITYTPQGSTAGQLKIRYPIPFPPITAQAWVGVIRFATELVGESPSFSNVGIDADGFGFELSFSW